MSWKQAKKAFVLQHPEKYIGNPKKLLYKSSWEQHAFSICDNNPNIVKWGYELVPITYAKPIGASFKITQYYPDLYLEYFDKNKNYIKEMIEIKPKSQTRPSRSRNVKTKLFENSTFLVNKAKWAAATQWCASRGIKFTIMTEKDLF